MNKIEISERGIVKEFPECWPEMTDDQFECVMQNWLKLMDGKINKSEFFVIVLYHFLGLKYTPLQKWKNKRLTPEQAEDKFSNIWMLTETLSWLFKDVEKDGQLTTWLDYSEITNPFPVLTNDSGVELIGPADALLNIDFGEYRQAWKHFEAFGNMRKDKDLNMLIATLFRQERTNFQEVKTSADFDGQRREAFNPNLSDHYAELVNDLPYWKKHTIYIWFFNCDQFLKTQELELDGKLISFAPLFQKPVEPEEVETLDETDLGLTKLLFELSETKLFGDMKEVDKTKYVDILTGLLHFKIQSDKLKSST